MNQTKKGLWSSSYSYFIISLQRFKEYIATTIIKTDKRDREKSAVMSELASPFDSSCQKRQKNKEFV